MMKVPRLIQVLPVRARGFTLIELMIVLVVIAVLAAIAYPGYQSQIRKSRRAAAVEAISAVQQAQERWRANNATYTGTIGSGGLDLPATSTGGYYNLSISGATGAAYVVTAAAASGTSQAGDTGCTSMVMTVSNGTGTPTPTACWSR
ncbi:MAG TPA: type IV pilin protein [Methylibium sp.]|nr:type IV pilin protein [Methylibium sp.]